MCALVLVYIGLLRVPMYEVTIGSDYAVGYVSKSIFNLVAPKVHDGIRVIYQVDFPRLFYTEGIILVIFALLYTGVSALAKD